MKNPAGCVCMVIFAVLAVTGCETGGSRRPTFTGAGKEVTDTVFYKNGHKKAERVLAYGTPNGLSTMWFENGQKMTEVKYLRGVKEGVETSWWENGKKRSEYIFRNGKRTGPVKEWWSNGQKQLEYSLVDGVPDGIFTSWWSNGQKRCEGMYKANMKVGMYKEWDETGTLLIEREFAMPAAPAPVPAEAIPAASENQTPEAVVAPPASGEGPKDAPFEISL